MVSAMIVGSKDRGLETVFQGISVRARTVGEEWVTSGASRPFDADLLVIDLRERQTVPHWLAGFRRQYPAVAILTVVSSLEPALILESMRAGVNECVPYPIKQADLETAVARLAQRVSPSQKGVVFGFLGAKGGVGTTTTAVNVAAALGTRPGRCLLIDLHLAHGDASVYLGAEARFSVVDALENIHRMDAAFFKSLVTKPKAGPDLLASSDRALMSSGASQNVRQLVDFATTLYEYVVLDVPRSDTASLDALDLASNVVVVANQELATVRNASRIAETLRHRYGRDRVSVMISRYDPQAEIGQDDIEKATGARVCATTPSDYRLALQALNAGRPLMIQNHSRLAASYRNLADQLAGQGIEKAAAPDRSGLFGRLLGKRG